MRGIRRPPPPPAEPPSSFTEANPRGRRDAPETAAESSIMPHQSQIPDLFADAEYSSDESETDDDIVNLNQRNGRSREPPASSSNNQKKMTAQPVSMSRIDPPDESIQRMSQFDGRSRSSTRGKSPRDTNTSSSRTDNNRTQTQRSQYADAGNPHGRNNSAMLLQEEEELLYEQYQDQLFHQQPYQFQQQQLHNQQYQPQQKPISSHYGQFNIAPMVEMTALNNNGIKKNKKQSQKKTKQKNQQSVQHSNNRGRYSSNTYSQLLNNNPKEEVDVENTIDRVLDTIPITEHGQSSRYKTHEEFYNLDNSESSDDESSYDDDDEERPLRGRSNSTNSSLHIISPPTFTSRIEHCYNKTIIILITLLSILFLRDHTPWYKRQQSKLAEERYQNNHVPDPMKVYNSADDDSTQARDHDPTNFYVKKKKKRDDVNKDDDDNNKKKNAYNRVSAGERISDRPAKKSLHHGFMDENYENRPPAKNSGLATAQKAGVTKNNNIHDEETEAFLASIQHTTKEEGTTTYVKHKPQSVVIPPPPPSRSSGEKTGSYSSSSSSGSSSSSFDSLEYNNSKSSIDNSSPLSSSSSSSFDSIGYKNSNTDVHSMKYKNSKSGIDYLDESNTTDVKPAPSSSFSDEPNTVLNMNDILDNDDDEGITIKPTPQSDAYSSSYNTASKTKTSKGNDYEYEHPDTSFGVNRSSDQGQSITTSSQNQHTTKQPASAFDQSMTTEDVKSVYKDAFYRWNHPFRHDELEEINGGIDVPVFWRIPRSASGVIEATMSYCYGLTLANALGAGFQDETLHKIKVPAGAEYVNVDVSTPKGIEAAAELDLASSGLADVISSPFIYETTAIFKDIPAAGKCFTLLRHPVDRAVSQYHFYQKEEGSTPSTQQYFDMTIDEFAEAVAENNWMVRFLTGKRSGTLSWHDLETAKEVFGRKCLVGLADRAEESIRRYERFFRWDKNVPNKAQKEKCLETTLTKHDKRQNHPTYEGSEAWEVLRKKNEYDVLLYEYATNLYKQQYVLYETYDRKLADEFEIQHYF